MKNNRNLLKKVKSINIISNTSIKKLIDDMSNTGFQGRKLAEICHIFHRMLNEKELTILLGYSGSLSVAGQWKIIYWLLENNYIDILVTTGANISEDIIEAMGKNYFLGDENTDDLELFKNGINRYYNIYGKEKDYLEMTNLISEFILTLNKDYNYTSREFLYLFGIWLSKKNINSIITIAAKNKIPVYCPAISDSPFGDAALIAKSKSFDFCIDSVKDYIEFMNLSKNIKNSGVFYIGGGVPKDFIQLFAVTPDLLFKNKIIPNRKGELKRINNIESYYPHKYAIQITTDSPQWGGLSGCTFDEAISWGKEVKSKNNTQCYCDATIALPIVASYISQTKIKKRKKNNFNKLFIK
jgi:deoxyhypusine synthase